MSDLESGVLEARRQVDAATRLRVRAEHDYEVAKADVRRRLTELREEHGVTSAEEARDRLILLESELSTALEELRICLDRAGV